MDVRGQSWEWKITWKVQDRSCSPSWTNWSMGKVTEILFSLVREAMGKERVTTCSPTAEGRQRAGFRGPTGLSRKQGEAQAFQSCVCVSSLTQWVGGCALEDEPVGGEEDGALSREQRRTSHLPRGLLAAVGDQVDPHGVHHQLLTGQQCWPQQLGLHTDRKRRGEEED